MNYHNVFRATNITEIPSAMNKVREARLWASRQPGHLQRMDFDFAPHFFGYRGRER